MNWKIILFIALVCYGGYQHFNKTNPNQFVLDTSDAGTVQLNGYQITPLEPFEIQARVLSTKRYTHGKEADLVPVDLALGWGPMADPNVIQNISITQSGRWYRWHVDAFPIPRRDIEIHSANMHLIPATPAIAKAIESAQVGEMVSFKGELVEVLDPKKGWRWKSSLTRKDTGAGACELVLVKSFRQL